MSFAKTTIKFYTNILIGAVFPNYATVYYFVWNRFSLFSSTIIFWTNKYSETFLSISLEMYKNLRFYKLLPGFKELKFILNCSNECSSLLGKFEISEKLRKNSIFFWRFWFSWCKYFSENLRNLSELKNPARIEKYIIFKAFLLMYKNLWKPLKICLQNPEFFLKFSEFLWRFLIS